MCFFRSRRLCPHCRRASDEETSAWTAVGCALCHGGYRGRVGLFQVMPITAELQSLISAGADVQTLARQACAEGVRSVYEDGCDKVRQGLTTWAEVHGAAHA